MVTYQKKKKKKKIKRLQNEVSWSNFEGYNGLKWLLELFLEQAMKFLFVVALSLSLSITE